MRLIGCLFFILFFFLKAGNLVSQDKIISKENQQWFQYYNQTNIYAKWSWLSDVGFRWRDGFKENSQYIVRTSIGYIINPSVRISSGFAHLGFFSSNKIQRFELRPYQEINVNNTYNKISISHRYRIEQRIFNNKNEAQFVDSFNFRFRYAFTLSIPLFRLSKDDKGKLFLLNFGDEILINAGNEIIYNVFDQNRVLFSPTLKLSEALSISLTWHYQISKTSVPREYRHINIFWLQLKHTLE